MPTAGCGGLETSWASHENAREEPMNRIASGLCLALGFAASSAAAETITLRVASFTPPEATETRLLEETFRRIREDSQGTIDFQMFSGGTLQPDPTVQLKLVEDGVADAAFVISGFQRNRQFPDDAVLSLPTLINTSLEGSLAYTHLMKEGLLSGYDQGNFVVIGAWTTPPMYMQTTFPVAKLEDLSGKKFQVANPVAAETIRAFGAVPVANISVAGVSEALSRGVVDGTLGDWLGVFSFRVVDATSHHVDGLPLSLATAFLPINKATWDKIPPEGKAAIEKHSGEAFARMAGEMLDSGAAHFRAELEKIPGHTIVKLTPEEEARFRARAQEVIDSWTANHPNGTRLYETIVSYLKSTR
jgi:TRAP-type C4-dicarboxylate transport system substrate-binding protein